MSYPISSCTVIKAALGDQAAFDWMVMAMTYNCRHGMFTQLPCECDPPCPTPTEEQMVAFNDRLNKAVNANLEKNRRPPGGGGTPSSMGDFSKWIFPVIKHMRLRRPWYRRFWNWVTRKPDPDDLRQIMLAQPLTKTTETQYYHEK
jgi:hypothetical protein